MLFRNRTRLQGWDHNSFGHSLDFTPRTNEYSQITLGFENRWCWPFTSHYRTDFCESLMQIVFSQIGVFSRNSYAAHGVEHLGSDRWVEVSPASFQRPLSISGRYAVTPP